MKPYYENINLDFLQIFSMLIYLAAFFFLLMFISKKLLLKDDKFNRYYFIGLLSMYFILLIGDIKFDYIPLFPDTQLYYDFLNNSNSFISSEELSRGFGLFARIIYLLSFKNIGIYILFNALINQIGILLLWKAFRIYKEDKVTIKNQRLYLIFTFLYPVAMLYSLTLLRESYFLLSFSIFVLGLIQKNKLNITLIIGTVLVILFRTKFIILCILLYIFKIIIMNKLSNKIKIMILLLGIPLIYMIINKVSSEILGIGLYPVNLQDFRNFQTLKYSESGIVYPKVEWSSWFDVLKDYPALIVQFLLSPLPILVEYDFLNSIAYTLDALYVIIALILFLINIRNSYKNLFWVSIILVIIILSSMFEYFLTGAVRHRYVAIIMFIPLLFSDKKEKSFYGSRSSNVFSRQKKYKTIDFTSKKYIHQNTYNKSN